jgi:fatty-acyl-CoA synthase
MDEAHSSASDRSEIQEWTVGQLLSNAAMKAGERIALKDGELTWTYKELHADSARLARFLLSHFKPGEHVAIWGANSAPWVLYQMAAAQAGLVLVTLNPALRSAEVEALLRQSQAIGLIADEEYRGVSLTGIIEEICPS